MNDETERQKIRGVIDEWLRASQQNDMDRLLSLMAEDVVFLLPGCEPMIGRSAFAAAARAPEKRFTFVEGHPHIKEILLLGGYAVTWNFLEVSLADSAGRVHHHAGNILSVFRRESDGRWVLFRDANLLTPKKNSP